MNFADENGLTIMQGPDSALWFSEGAANKIGRITTSGSITEFSLPTPSRVPINIVAGPNTTVWFTEKSVQQIGRIS